MKPNKCNLGHQRPDTCVQTLFGLNLEKRGEIILIHGDLKTKKNSSNQSGGSISKAVI